jgi:hypothetical protein
LARNNPTLGNLELSMHIDRIDCYDDGKVVLRTCKLGAVRGCELIESCPRNTPCFDQKTGV